LREAQREVEKGIPADAIKDNPQIAALAALRPIL